MAKPQSPLVGFNNNVRHKGKVFHIQTEDSGIRYPHVITHLFADGGRILKTLKTSYAEHVASDDLADKVRNLMKEQHKAMFVALRDGHYDDLLFGAPARVAGAPPSVAQPPAPTSTGPTSVPRPAPQSVPRPAGSDARPVPPTSPTLPSVPSARAPGSSPPMHRQPPADVRALERAAAQAQRSSPLFEQARDLPPPPAAVLSPKPMGAYRATTKSSSSTKSETSTSSPVISRPASIFGTSRPAHTGSVFGEELISGKSLDEVILSFLSEEFGAGPDDDKSK